MTGVRRFDDAGEDGARADVAVPADDGPSTEDGTHVDHAALPHHGTDVDDRAHHDDGVVADLDLLADDRPRFDAGVHAPDVEKGHARVATVGLDDIVLDDVGVPLEHVSEARPVAEDDLVTRTEHARIGAEVHLRALALADVDLDRRLLRCRGDVVDDLLCVHDRSFRKGLPPRTRRQREDETVISPDGYATRRT